MKRVLAFLLCLCMVLTVIPANVAFVTKAADSGELVLDANNKGLCPACNEVVTWTAYKGSNRLGSFTDGIHRHYYLSGDVTAQSITSSLFRQADGSNVCLHLNGHNITTGAYIQVVKSVLNIMGTGNVTFTATSTGDAGYRKYGFMISGTVNLLGGNYALAEAALETGIPMIYQSSGQTLLGDVTMSGPADIVKGSLTLSNTASAESIRIDTNGQLIVAADWSGQAQVDFAAALEENLVPKANGVAEGSFTGKLTMPYGVRLSLAEEGKLLASGVNAGLILDAEGKALCPACNEVVTWTAHSGSSRFGSFTDGKHRHYYLSGDVTAQSITSSLFRQANGSNVCLHLNGHDIITGAYIHVDKSVLNIMGAGNVTFTATSTGDEGYRKYGFFISGTVNLLGGSYSLAEAALETGIPMIYQTSGDTVLGDAAISGLADISGGSLKLCNTASMESIRIDTDSKLIVAADWSGKARVDFAAALIDGAVPVANGEAEGIFSGSLLSTGGRALIGTQEGSLVLDDFNKNLTLDADNKALCPKCNEVVTWTAIQGNKKPGTFLDGNRYHYYLSGDVNMPDAGTNFLRLASGSQLCLHLNGHNIIHGERMFVIGGTTLSIMGHGNVTFTATTTDTRVEMKEAGILTSGTVNLIGGTYDIAETAITEGRPYIRQTSGKLTVEDAAINGPCEISGGTVTLDAQATLKDLEVGTGGKLLMKKSWIGSAEVNFMAGLQDNIVPIANGETEGSFTGKLTTPDGAALKGFDDGTLRRIVTLELDENNQGFCPVCNKTVTWTAYSGSNRLGSFTDGQHRHYYLSGDVTAQAITSSLFRQASGSDVCLHLNDHNIISGAYIQVQNSTLNIMGTGNVTFTATSTGDAGYRKYGFFVSGTVNLLGGNYSLAEAALETGIPMIYQTSGDTVLGDANMTGLADITGGSLTLSKTASIESIRIDADSKLTAAEGWAGKAQVRFDADLTENTVPQANGASTGAFVGGLVMEDGTILKGENGLLVVHDYNTLLINDANRGYCKVCNQVVTWKPIGEGDAPGTHQAAGGTHAHYYIAEDNITAKNVEFMYVKENNVVCLHLNGKSIKIPGRMRLMNGTLNVLGDGNVDFIATTATEDHNSCLFYCYGTPYNLSKLNLYGGTYTSSAGKPVLYGYGTHYTVMAVVKLYGNTNLNGLVTIDQCQLYLNDGATIKHIDATNTGSVRVDKNWYGTAKVEYLAKVYEEYINIFNGRSDGDFVGGLVLADGRRLIGESGKLRVVSAMDLRLDAENKGYCPVCGKVVAWTALSGNKTPGKHADGQHRHFYLSGDLDAQASTDFLHLAESADVCLHLNGHNLTYGSAMTVENGSSLTVLGEGNVTYTGTSDLGGIVSAGTVNLLGGSYTGKTLPALYITDGQVTVKDATINSDNHLKKGTLVLDGSAALDSIHIEAAGLLNVLDTWTGTAAVEFLSGLTGTLAPSSNVSMQNATGKLTLLDGRELKVDEDGVSVSGVQAPENLSYKLYEDHAEILSYTGDGTFLLPTQIAGKPVTKIAGGAFTSFSGKLYIGKNDEFGLSYARTEGLSFTQIAAINGTAGYTSVEDAIRAFQSGVIQLLTDADSITVNKDTYLDLNGFDINDVTVTNGTLYVMDSQTDDFTVADGNYGKITGTVTGTVKAVPADADCAQYGYLQVKQAEGISFHCIAMDIYTMTLRPDVAGVYYGCSFAGDEVAASMIKSYGIALSVYGDPDETRKDWLGSDFKVFNAGENKKGAVLAGVMKKGIADMDNQVRANTPVYGRLYIKTESGYVFGQTVCRDLQEQMELTDQKWEELTKDLRVKTRTMYETYKTVMDNWDISHAPNYVDRIWFTEPAPDTGAGWEQYSLPIGNGYLGTSIFGGTETETLALSDKTMFNPTSSATEATDVPAGEEVMASSVGSNGFTNLCKVHIDFGHSFDQVTNYQRDLLLDTAEARVNYDYKGVTYNRTYFANYPDNVTVAKLTASQKGKLTFTLRPEPTYIRDYLLVKGDGMGKTGTVTASGDTSILSGTLSAYNINYEAQFKVIPVGGTMTANADGTITVTNADSAVILISAGTNYELTPEVMTAANKDKLDPNSYPHDKVTAAINAAAEKSYEQLLETHLQDYRALYARVETDLGGEPSTTVPTDKQMQAYREGQHSAYIEELLFKHGRYLLICSSREGTLPTNLQGMWQYYASAAWRGGYVYNINLQMNYWSCYATNLVDLFNSNIEYFDVMRSTLEQNADNYLTGVKSPYISEKGTGANGIAVGAYGTPYVSPKVSTGVSTHSGPATTAYTTSLFWDYYEFTGDKEILENVVYPYIEGAAIFLSKTLENYDGKWLVSHSASPENNMWFEEPFVTVGTMFDQQFIYETYCQVLEAAEILGYTAEDHPILNTIHEQIDKLDHVIVGKSGHIKEFREEEYYGEFGRYEHHGMAQLIGVYPAAIITSETDAWQDAATVTATERGINYTGHQSSFKQLVWARLGNSDYAYLLAQDHITKYLRDNLWNTHTPFQIDGNFGYTAGVAEMLVQSHEGYISVLPALPEAWSTGSYKGLTARGGFEVGAAWNNGSATQIQITSNNGGECSVKYFNLSTAKVTDSKGNTVSFTVNDRDVITFATTPGETYTITNLSERVTVEAPADLTLTNGTKLSWEASPDAVSYKVYRAVNSQGTYELVADKVTGTTYTYVPTDLKAGDQLILRVTAVNADGVESDGIRTITWIP